MFDNVGRSTDEEATLRSFIALGIVGAFVAFVWVCIVVYGLLMAILFVSEEVMGIEIDEDQLVDLILEEEEPELEAPPPPPPPPPPPAAAQEDEEDEEEEEDVQDTPDEMVEEVAELEKPPEEELKNAKQPKGEVGGVEGGVEGGVVGGVQGGVEGGELGGRLGGAKAFHHSEVTVRRRVTPRYPDEAKSMNLGDVSCRVRIFIDETGKPYDVQFMACPKVFHASAKEALFNWRWYPAKSDGQKVKATFPLVIRYKLRN